MVWVILIKTFTETFKNMLRSFIFEGMVTEVTNDQDFHNGRFFIYIEERMGSVKDLMGWFLCIPILTGQVTDSNLCIYGFTNFG